MFPLTNNTSGFLGKTASSLGYSASLKLIVAIFFSKLLSIISFALLH